MKDFDVFLGTSDETCQEAIARFKSFCEAQMTDYFSNKDYPYRFCENKAYAYHAKDKVLPASIADFEIRWQVKVPHDLTDLLCRHGAFAIGDCLFDIFGGRGEGAILTLPQVLAKYGHSAFVERISGGMLRSLSGFYYFFGVSFPESDEMSFLYFSKAGNFGKMLFSVNNPSLVLNKVLPSMFNGSIDKYTLDNLISNQIDRVVVNALTVKGYIG